MRVYGELWIRGGEQALSRFVAALEGGRRSGWSRRTEREAEVGNTGRGPLYCFQCLAGGSRPACELWMASGGAGELHVSNIAPSQGQSLSCDQYNSVLRDFYKNCAVPAASSSGAKAELGKTDPQLEDLLPHDAAQRLREFLRLADGAAPQPEDERRWKGFVAAAQGDGVRLDGSLLSRWLVEEERWPREAASRLAAEYERGRAR